MNALISDIEKGADSPLLAELTNGVSVTSPSQMARVLLTNKVKKCPLCKKANAFTLVCCNQCGGSLVSIEASRSANVFMGFVFGFERAGAIPLRISLRGATPDIIVMDDLLALAPLHFNIIPTAHYIPDWRYLLLKPKIGLALINDMLAAGVSAGQSLITNDTWADKFINSRHAKFSLADHIGAGFNYPPSQYQLHIQFCAPLLLPFQLAQFIKGVHFTHGRFFPFNFVKDTLERLASLGIQDGFATLAANRADLCPAGVAYCDLFNALGCKQPGQPLSLHDSEDCFPDLTKIVSFIDTVLGINYNDVHASFMDTFRRNQATFANWSAADFQGHILTAASTSSAMPDSLVGEFSTLSTSSVINADRIVLQSYGRPYAEDGRPTGCFYPHTKHFADIDIW